MASSALCAATATRGDGSRASSARHSSRCLYRPPPTRAASALAYVLTSVAARRVVCSSSNDASVDVDGVAGTRTGVTVSPVEPPAVEARARASEVSPRAWTSPPDESAPLASPLSSSPAIGSSPATSTLGSRYAGPDENAGSNGPSSDAAYTPALRPCDPESALRLPADPALASDALDPNAPMWCAFPEPYEPPPRARDEGDGGEPS